MENENNDGLVRRLPLWRDWMETKGEKLTFGAVVPLTELIESLSCDPQSMKFAMAISDIRKEFRTRGMNFTSRGQKGAGFVIEQPENNQFEIRRMGNAMVSLAKESVILGSATPTDKMTDEQRRKHEAITEKMATRLALISRTKPKEIE